MLSRICFVLLFCTSCGGGIQINKQVSECYATASRIHNSEDDPSTLIEVAKAKNKCSKEQRSMQKLEQTVEASLGYRAAPVTPVPDYSKDPNGLLYLERRVALWFSYINNN
jgi:hypothetical protein